MENQALEKARNYEKKMEKKITANDRPGFHLSARVGWMNDPNGFSFYEGEYHLFYQYYPYNSFWGPMHWGHAVSKDLLKWEYLPVVMAPEKPYDKDGCFSGSAIALPDGRHLLMYTGVRKEKQPDGRVRDIQTQCLAVGDGKNYEKYEGNPVLTEKDLPAGASRFDFRDPKIWQEEDGTYRCVVGNCTPDQDGRTLLYQSEDGFHWKYITTLAENKDRFGKMWECPDFFGLDGKYVLLTSPQDMLPKGFEYHNGNGTLCLIGDFDKETNTFTEKHDQSIDYGIDFYASQTILSPDGRRIMIGWMQNWDTCNLHTKDQPWFGQMSLPRELSIRDGRLIQKPIRELENFRGAAVRHENVVVNDVVQLDGIHGRKVDIQVSIRPAEGKEIFQKFAIRFAQNGTCHTALSFRPHESILKVDRKFSGSRRAIINQRRGLVRTEGGCLELRLILDTYSAEVFVNDGEQVFTLTFYTDQTADGISFFADGEAVIDVVKYDLML